MKHTLEEKLENKRFRDRLSYRSNFWEKRQELRSFPPSTWPALEEALRKWGIPIGFRPTGFMIGRFYGRNSY
jgi:hypothetical protein